MTIVKALGAFVVYYFFAIILSAIFDRPFYETVAIVALSAVSYLAVRE